LTSRPATLLHGGNISELILAKLAQRPLAWDVPRRGRAVVYPSHAAGPLVVLVNENTGMDRCQ